MNSLIVATVSFIAPFLLFLTARYGSPPGCWDSVVALWGTDVGDTFGLAVGASCVFILCVHNFFDALLNLIINRRSAKADQRECPAEPVK